MPEPSTAPVQRGPTSGTFRAVSDPKPPILASEALREELAPLQPALAECRVWLVGIALALAALGVAFRVGVGVPASHVEAATVAFSTAGAVTAAAALPFPYALRAAVALLVASVLMVLGLRGTGPLAGLTVDGTFAGGVARLATLSVLPAALFFRSRYRAYRRARVLLAVALLLTLPFIGTEVLLAVERAAPWVARVGAVVSITAVLCALFGFAGEGTTGFGAVWAVLVLAGLSAEVALRQFTLADADTGLLTYPATALGLLAAGTLASLGIFQLLAAFLAPEARRLSLVGGRTTEDPPTPGGNGIA